MPSSFTVGVLPRHVAYQPVKTQEHTAAASTGAPQDVSLFSKLWGSCFQCVDALLSHKQRQRQRRLDTAIAAVSLSKERLNAQLDTAQSKLDTQTDALTVAVKQGNSSVGQNCLRRVKHCRSAVAKFCGNLRGNRDRVWLHPKLASAASFW